MPMYNLIECSDNYAKKSVNFWQCCREEPDNYDKADSGLLKFK